MLKNTQTNDAIVCTRLAGAPVMIAVAAVIAFGAAPAFADHDTDHVVQNLKGGLGALEKRVWDCEHGNELTCPGVKGDAGPQGPAGPAGADSTVAGPAGPEGPEGPEGPAGPAGADSTVAGPVGPEGPEGPEGPAGPAGADSTVAGPEGPEGPAGPAGADSTVAGPAGPAGADGVDGTDLDPQALEDLQDKLDNLLSLATGKGLVFVTSNEHTGALGGLQGADDICNSLADNAGLHGTYMAWLGTTDSTNDPASRFEHRTGPYVRPDGVRVADDWTELTSTQYAAGSNTLQNPINVDENGVTLVDDINMGLIHEAWTGVLPSGVTQEIGENPMFTCQEWTVAGQANGGIGGANAVSASWTDRARAGGPGTDCWRSKHLYCFGQ